MTSTGICEVLPETTIEDHIKHLVADNLNEILTRDSSGGHDPIAESMDDVIRNTVDPEDPRSEHGRNPEAIEEAMAQMLCKCQPRERSNMVWTMDMLREDLTDILAEIIAPKLAEMLISEIYKGMIFAAYCEKSDKGIVDGHREVTIKATVPSVDLTDWMGFVGL